MGTITQIFRITGGLDRSWLQSMREGEDAARQLERSTNDAGDAIDDMSGEAQGASGIIGRLTSSLGGAKGALLGVTAAVGGAITAIALLGSSARQTLDDMQELSLFVPEWDLSQVSALQDSLTSLGLSEQGIDRIFDALGEGALRAAEGQSLLSSSLQQMILDLQTDGGNAGVVLEALRAEYDRLVNTFGSGEARRIFDESFGGTGSEGFFQLRSFTETGELEDAFNRFQGFSQAQIEAMREAARASAQFGLAMDTLRAQITLTLEPVFRAVQGFTEWYYNSGLLQSILKEAIVPTLILVGGLLTILAVKAAIAGVAMVVAMGPVGLILGGVVVAVAAITAVIKNWPSIWDSIKRAVEPVVDFFKSIVNFIREILNAPGWVQGLVRAGASVVTPSAAPQTPAQGVRAISNGAQTYNSTSSSSIQSNRSIQVNIDARTDSDLERGQRIADGVAAADRAL